MADKRGDPLAYETPVNQGAFKKRSLFYMDGWHFACPVMIPGFAGVLLTGGVTQAEWVGFTVATAFGAIALHQWNPWYLSDLLVELMSPRYLTDIVSDDLGPIDRFKRFLGLVVVDGSP